MLDTQCQIESVSESWEPDTCVDFIPTTSKPYVFVASAYDFNAECMSTYDEESSRDLNGPFVPVIKISSFHQHDKLDVKDTNGKWQFAEVKTGALHFVIFFQVNCFILEYMEWVVHIVPH